MKRRVHKGFSLIEVVLAMAITVTVLVTLFGILSMAIQTQQNSRADTVMVYMADSVKANLLADDTWPVGSSAKTKPFTETVYFNMDGLMVTNTSEAFYRAELNFIDSPNYPSKRLDFVVMEVTRIVNTNRVLASFTLQRFYPKGR